MLITVKICGFAFIFLSYFSAGLTNLKMTLNISNLELDGKNIVVVEDDLPSIRYYETLLKKAGADVKVFRTGKDFVDYLNQGNSKIDFVFVEFLVPLINGVDCIRMFREKRKSTPVIMITAHSSEQIKTEAYLAGCNEYILKPIYPEKILFILTKYLTSEISVSRSN
jgi:DNA-binding response OmpR family regulator